MLAAIALLLQIALPGFHSPLPLGSDGGAGALSGAFGEHALCLARDRGDAQSPADEAPKPFYHEFSACCFWHGNTGLVLTPAAALEPVAFAPSRIDLTPPGQIAPRRLSGAIGARAPPVRA